MKSLIRSIRWLQRRLSWYSYRIRLGSLGEGSELGRWLELAYPERIAIGKRVGLSSRVTLRANTQVAVGIAIGDETSIQDAALLAANQGSIVIGQHSWLGPFCMVYGNGGVSIGDHVLIAAHCVINTVSHNTERCDLPISEQGINCAPVVIENDVWIGSRAVIMQGVTLGHGAIIGAGSVVTTNIPPYSIAVGTPARVIRRRDNAPGNP
jgi:acetyltransferase-like isoleucine patch superfamily enzyme